MLLTSTLSDAPTFGDLLKQLRKRAGLKQGELAARVGFSGAMLSRLEQNERLPDLQLIIDTFVPALGLQDEPHLATRLVELAALARGERPQTAILHQRQSTVVVSGQASDSPSALPVPPSELIGREQEVNLLCTRLQNHNGRLLTLLGPPGIGKTRLALAVAARMQHIYQGGAHFIPLAAINQADRVATTLAIQLGISDTSQKPAHQKLIEFLRHKQILLILDNFEQLIVAAPLLAELLSECPNLSLLVTSRERLHLRAEQRYNVPSLALSASVALFIQRAQAIDAEFTPSAQQQPILEAICRKLDCLPLAIELCASRIEFFTPKQLLARLQDQRLDLLSDGPSDLPAQHRTLRNAIHRSYTLLNGDEQSLFCGLSVFVSSFAGEAVQALGFAEYTLQSLLQKSLVHHAPALEEQRRFLLLETLREYAGEQLQSSGQTNALRQRHAEYYLTLVEEATRQIPGKQQLVWLQRLDAELENLRAAFHYFLQHRPVNALSLAGALKEFWYTRGYFQEGQQWLTQALSACQPITLLGGYLPAQARALLSLAQLAQHQGDRQQALQWVDESIALYRQLGDRWGTAEALRESGWVMYGLHQKQPTLARFEESLQLFRQTGDQAKIASLLTTLVHLQAGKEFDYTQSITYLRESILLLRTTDDTNALFFALTSQADFELQYGNYNAAEVVLNESLNIAQALGMQRDRAIALSQMGNVKLCQGDAPSALGYVQAALEIAQTIGDRDHCMHDWLLLGKVQKALDNLPAAQAAFAETLALCLSLENRHVASECLLHCGEIALNQKNDRWAVQLFAATQKMFDTLTPYLKPIDNTGLIEQIDQARTRLSEADFATAWAVGQGWSFEQAVSTARQWIVAL